MLGAPLYKKDIKPSGRVQRKAKKIVRSVEDKTLMMAYSSSLEEQRGSTDLCSLVAATGPEGMAWSCVGGGSRWALGKVFSPKGGGHGTKLLVWIVSSDIGFEL